MHCVMFSSIPGLSSRHLLALLTVTIKNKKKAPDFAKCHLRAKLYLVENHKFLSRFLLLFCHSCFIYLYCSFLNKFIGDTVFFCQFPFSDDCSHL